MDCCQDGCDTPAHLAVYWPSLDGPVLMCPSHAATAHHVADVMGFKLPLGPLDPLLEPLAIEVEEALDPEVEPVP